MGSLLGLWGVQRARTAGRGGLARHYGGDPLCGALTWVTPIVLWIVWGIVLGPLARGGGVDWGGRRIEMAPAPPDQDPDHET